MHEIMRVRLVGMKENAFCHQGFYIEFVECAPDDEMNRGFALAGFTKSVEDPPRQYMLGDQWDVRHALTRVDEHCGGIDILDVIPWTT